MDPTLRHTVAVFLDSLADDHQLSDDPNVCTCGVDLTAIEQPPPAMASLLAHVLGVIGDRFAAPELHPHRVHQKGAILADDPVTVATPAQDDDPRPKGTKVTGSRYQGALSCPDCGRGLIGRDDGGMLCSQLSPAAAPASCHPGCIVACGQKGGD